MKYQGIRKLHEGKFITRYDVDYITAEGRPKTYEMISRNPDIRTLEDLQNRKADSVILILTDESGERILVNREYRMAMAQWIYNFPAGLIDPGETPGQAAVREMREETGFHFTEYTGGEAFARRPFFLAPGFTDEPGSAVFGFADADGRRELESSEWIEVFLADREEVRRILREEKVSLRCAFLMMHFLQQPDEEPFRFLDCRF